MKELSYNVYVKGEEPESMECNDIVISSRRELEILRLCLGDRVNFITKKS